MAVCRLIETDVKSLNSLQSNSGHSRRSSDTSQISEISQMNSESYDQDVNGRDVWQIWGQLINDWNNQYKKKTTLQVLIKKPDMISDFVFDPIDAIVTRNWCAKAFPTTCEEWFGNCCAMHIPVPSATSTAISFASRLPAKKSSNET